MILFTQVTAIYLPTLLFFMILILLASIREMRSEGSQFMQKLIDEKPSANSSEFPDHSSTSGFHIVIWKLRWDPSIINTFIIAHMTCKLRTRTLDKWFLLILLLFFFNFLCIVSAYDHITACHLILSYLGNTTSYSSLLLPWLSPYLKSWFYKTYALMLIVQRKSLCIGRYWSSLVCILQFSFKILQACAI